MYDILITSLRKNPFIRIVIPFIIGIVISINFTFSSVIILSIFVASAIAFVVFALIERKFSRIWINGVLINLIFISSGMFLTQSLNEKAVENLSSNKQGNLIGVINKEPKLWKLQQKLS